MKKWLFVPITVLPYLLIAALAFILHSADVPLFGKIMDTVFGGNGLIFVLCVFIFAFICCTVSFVGVMLCLSKNEDAMKVAKTAMIIMLCQIPAYVLLFVLGLMFLITLFTIPFAIGIAVLEYGIVLMTGFFNIAAVLLAGRQGYKASLWYILLQFFFCADVVTSVVFYVKLKKQMVQADAEIIAE